MIVTSGALGDVFGRRRVFLAGLVLFVASCVLIASPWGRGGDRGPDDPGRGGFHHPGLRDEPAVGRARAARVSCAPSPGGVRHRPPGAAVGPLVGGVLVDTTGWQGLFWIDAAIAAACIPLTVLTVAESRDPNRPRSIDIAGTVLIAVILAPLVLALSEGSDWGWFSGPTLVPPASIRGDRGVRGGGDAGSPLRWSICGCSATGFWSATTLAILIVAGAINALMFLLSLYFQDPATFGMSALDAGLATLPAAAAMIAITPLITRWRSGSGPAPPSGLGFAVAPRIRHLGIRHCRMDLRGLRSAAHRRCGGPRAGQRAGVICLDRSGDPGGSRAGLRHLQHGPLHRRIPRRRRRLHRATPPSPRPARAPANRPPTPSPRVCRAPRFCWQSQRRPDCFSRWSIGRRRPGRRARWIDPLLLPPLPLTPFPSSRRPVR